MEFTKMQGAGNDFILVDGFKNRLEDVVPKIEGLCHRKFGIGADGLIIALPSDVADAKMFYYNGDGTQGEMCGNGIRCFAKFVYEKGIFKNKNMKIETLAGIQTATLEIDENDEVQQVEIEMGNIKYLPSEIVVDLPGENVFNQKLEIKGREITFSSVLSGVPHTVVFIEKEDEFGVEEFGSLIENHPIFPNKTNVNFVLPLSEKEIKIFSWERGAGRTLACGTGSCASALLAHKLKGMNEKIKVITEGGILEITVLSDTKIKLKGGAGISFEGVVDLQKY